MKINFRSPYWDMTDKEKKVHEQKVNVLLVDDHQIMRRGIKGLINAEADLFVVAEASNGREAIKFAREMLPDVIMMDVNMPIMNGIKATKEIVSVHPSTKIIGLSMSNDNDAKQSILNAGACAYLSKSDALESLCETIRNVLNHHGRVAKG